MALITVNGKEGCKQRLMVIKRGDSMKYISTAQCLLKHAFFVRFGEGYRINS
jgi:hypothetical protein